MKVAVFSTKVYDRTFLETVNINYGHELIFLEPRLHLETSILANECEAVCVFVNDQLDRATITQLARQGVRLIALRCAGFNNVDLIAAKDYGLTVVRVPAYSPYAVAEHTVGMMLSLNRKFYRAYSRVRENNFALEGLLGFDMHGKTVGIIGTGKIGAIVAQILKGFGCQLLAYDVSVNNECQQIGVEYVALTEIFQRSDIITLHCPLTPQTQHLIDVEAFNLMKNGVMLINTSRGALIDTKAAIKALKSGKIAYLGLDVYEQESDLFFEDLSDRVIQDDVFQRLLTFPNVLITGHQAFFTDTALKNIAETTLGNISDFASGRESVNEVTIDHFRKAK